MEDPVVGAPLPLVVTDFQRDVYCLLGLPFDAVALDDAVARVHAAAMGRHRCFLSTPNLNFVVGCRDDADFRRSVLSSDLSVADGMPLVWVARALCIPIRERVAGSSLLDALRAGTTTRIRMFLFGGADGVAARAGAAINATSRGVDCIGALSPGFGSVAELSSPDTIAAINRSDADLLVVAMSAKKGQAWIVHNLARLTTPVIVDLGAVINFAAGTVRRAPVRWQRLGIEWLWRIKEEPALWRRYFSDGLGFLRMLWSGVLPLAIEQRLRRIRDVDVARGAATVRDAGGSTVLTLAGSWVHADLRDLRDALAVATSRRADVIVDAGALSHLDSAAVGLLQLLAGHQQKVGRRLQLRGFSPAMRRRLARHGARYLLDG